MVDASIPLVVSLSPFINRTSDLREIGHVYQAMCVDTWRANGFRVVSVNAEIEVGRIAALYPGVEIVVASRHLGATVGKPLIPLAEMIEVLRGLGGRIGGIVNSDVFIPPCDFSDWLRGQFDEREDRHIDGLYLNRQEVPHPTSSGGDLYKFGLDAFFFRLSALENMDYEPFAIGLPWWDYYLPMSLLLAGRRLARVDGAPLLHLSHPQKWDIEGWRLMFEAFRGRLRPLLDELHQAKGNELPTLTALMHEDRMVTYLTDHPVRRTLEDRGFDAAQRYREGYSLSVSDLVYQLSDEIRFAGQIAV